MKNIIIGLILAALAGCMETPGAEVSGAFYWGLEVMSSRIQEESSTRAIQLAIRYLVDDEEKRSDFRFNLPTSSVTQIKADEILEVAIEAVDYRHPVFIHLIRHDNLHEISWPEEAHKAETTRFFYRSVEDLTDGFSALGPFSEEEVRKAFGPEVLSQALGARISAGYVQNALREVEPTLEFSEFDGEVQTGTERYEVRTWNSEYTDGGVSVEFAIRSRKGNKNIESMDIEVGFPIGEFENHSEVVTRLTDRFIAGFLESAGSSSAMRDWLLDGIYTPLHWRYDGRVAEVGDYLFITFREAGAPGALEVVGLTIMINPEI